MMQAMSPPPLRPRTAAATPPAAARPSRKRLVLTLALLTAGVLIAHGGVWQWAAARLSTPHGAVDGSGPLPALSAGPAALPVTVMAAAPAPAPVAIPAPPPPPTLTRVATASPPTGAGRTPTARQPVPAASGTALGVPALAPPSTPLTAPPVEAGAAASSPPSMLAPEAAPAEPPAARGQPGGLAPARAQAASAIPPATAPSDAQLRYALRRGALRGQGVLTWRQSGDRYRMELIGEAPLLGRLLTQRSEGQLQPGGLEPLRYTESRIGRSERAVNFVRPADGSAPRLSFSSRTDSLPMQPHTQDRLSWMAQLAARLQAHGSTAPALGHTVEMAVASVSGDLQPWTFVLQAVEAGPLWHWRRGTDDPYDTRADVWTDPRHQHWPVRVELREARGDPLELRMRDIGTPP